MQFLKFTCNALFLILAVKLSVAQITLPPPAFVSIYGNFSIALAETPYLTRGLRNDEAPDQGTGMIYAWEAEKVVYTALYLDPLDAAGNTSAAEKVKGLRLNNERVRETIDKYVGKIISEKPFALGANSGVEIRAALGTGAMIVRNFQVERREYSIQAIVSDLNDVAKALQILDSFKLIDGRALMLKKIAANTPKPLPQMPAVKTPKSDLETANLKGKVKTVTEENEDLSGDAFQQGRLFSAEYFYNQNGFLNREIRYDKRGNPVKIALYGFIGRALVAKFGTIRYPYSAPSKTPEKPSNRQFDVKIKYFYDKQGRVNESKYYGFDGELSSRTLTVYDKNRAAAQNFNAAGELVSKTLQTFDEKGNLTASVIQSRLPKAFDYKAIYTYEEFYEKGNWTRRILSEWQTVGDKSFYVPVTINYRSFVYYR